MLHSVAVPREKWEDFFQIEEARASNRMPQLISGRVIALEGAMLFCPRLCLTMSQCQRDLGARSTSGQSDRFSLCSQLIDEIKSLS